MKLLLLFCTICTALKYKSIETDYNTHKFWAVYKHIFNHTKHVTVVVPHQVSQFSFFFKNAYKNHATLHFSTKHAERSLGVLLFVSTIEELHDIVIGDGVFWTRVSSYLIFSLNCSININKALFELWKLRKIYKVVFVCDIKQFNTFMYVPLLFGINGRLRKIYNFKDIDYFIKYGVHNLQAMTIKTSLYPSVSSAIKINDKYIGGHDWHALKTLSQFMNFTPIVSLPSDNTGYGNLRNNTFSGPFKDILEGKTDIVMIGHFLRNYTKQYFLLTQYISQEYVCIALPQATRMPHFNTIIQIFQFKIWLCLLFIYIFSILVNVLIFKLSTRRSLNKLSVLDLAFSIYELSITGVIILRSKMNSYRVLLSFLFLTVIVINNAFQGSLVTFISTPLHYANIDTIQDLVASPLPIVVSQSVWEEIYFEDPDMSDLLNKMRIETDLSKYAEGYLALFIRLPYNLRYIYKNYVSFMYPESVKPFHLMEESIINYYTAYLVPQDSPYLERINNFLLMIQENGLIQKWDSEVVVLSKNIFLPQVYGELNEKESRAFSLNDLDFAFHVLIVGLTFSTVLFIIEHVVYMKCKVRYDSKNCFDSQK